MEERKKGLLDTEVFLKFFLGEEDKGIVRSLLDKCVTREIEGFVSVVTVFEIVTICIRDKKEFLIPMLLEFIHPNQKLYVSDPNQPLRLIGHKNFLKGNFSCWAQKFCQRQNFSCQNFAVIDTTSDIAVLSGYFKAKYSKGKRTLSHADSVILACAFVYGCPLITYDREFEGVKEIEILKPDEYLGKLKL